jgi:virginiamycin A acetyltransferase
MFFANSFRDDVIKELVKIDYAKVDRKFIERHEDIWYRKVMDTESVHDLLKELDRWQSRKIMH